MYTYNREPLTQENAKTVADEWIDKCIEDGKPTEEYSRSQVHWLMHQLAALCIEEALKYQEDENGLCHRLSDAHEILHNVWYEGALEAAKKWWRGDKKPAPDEQKTIDLANRIVWRRHDPLNARKEGHASKDYNRMRSLLGVDRGFPPIRAGHGDNLLERAGRPFLRAAAGYRLSPGACGSQNAVSRNR